MAAGAAGGEADEQNCTEIGQEFLPMSRPSLCARVSSFELHEAFQATAAPPDTVRRSFRTPTALATKMPARSTQPSIEDIFSMAQESCAKHKKCAAALRKLQSSMPFEEFAADFFSCVACVLPVFKRERAVERIVEFVVAYTTQGAEGEAVDEALMESVCARLLKLSAAKDKAVRFRVIQLVGQMMNALAEEAEVSDELFESIEEAAVERCKDKVPVVRAWALRALFRLQDPADADDRITKALLRAMAHDASKEVRMAAVSTVAPSKHAIRAILERTRDTEPEVSAPSRRRPGERARAQPRASHALTATRSPNRRCASTPFASSSRRRR